MIRKCGLRGGAVRSRAALWPGVQAAALGASIQGATRILAKVHACKTQLCFAGIWNSSLAHVLVSVCTGSTFFSHVGSFQSSTPISLKRVFSYQSHQGDL